MKNAQEFKKKLQSGEFGDLFAGVKSAEDIAKLAKKLGYDVKPSDVKNTTLTDDMLEAVAGGAKGSNTQGMGLSATGGQGIEFDGVHQSQTDPTAVSSPETNPTIKPIIGPGQNTQGSRNTTSGGLS